MKKTYLKLYFSSEGPDPMEVIDKVKGIGFKAVVGNFDFVIEFDTPEEYGGILAALHETLRGTNTRFTLTSKELVAED